MKAKNLKRILSLCLCAALLVSMFTVSFTASATVTENGDSTLYEWDFTDTANGEEYLSEMLNASTLLSAEANDPCTSLHTYNEELGAYEAGVDDTLASKSALRGALINSPDGMVGKSFNLSGGSLYAAASQQSFPKVIFASDECGFFAISPQFKNGIFFYSVYYYTYKFNTDGSISNVIATPTANSGTHRLLMDYVNGDPTEVTGDAQSVITDLTGKALNHNTAAINAVTWNYDVQVDDDFNISIVLTANYLDDSFDYEFTSTTLEYNLESLLANSGMASKLSGYTHTKFMPNFGYCTYYSSSAAGAADVDNKATQIYAMNAEYVDAGDLCFHETTELQGVKEATCTEAGYTGDYVCTNCEVVVVAGKDVAALGHRWIESERVDATIEEAGYYINKCSRCEITETFVLDKLTPYTVTFYAEDGSVHDQQTVGEGLNATQPDAPTSAVGNTFIGWDTVFTNVRSDLDVYPVFLDETEQITTYTFDFSPSATPKEDFVKLNYFTKLSTMTDACYDEEKGAAVIPWNGSNRAMLLNTPVDAVATSMTLTGSSPDANGNNSNYPGVIFAEDDMGVYAYKFRFINNAFFRDVFYMSYNATKTGFASSTRIHHKDFTQTQIVSVNGEEITPTTSFKTATGGAYTHTADDSKFYNFTFDVAIEEDGAHIITTIDYDNGAGISYTFGYEEEVYNLEYFIENAENLYNADFATNLNNGKNTHTGFKYAFGIFQSKVGDRTADMVGDCYINYVEADYELPSMEDCIHDERSYIIEGYVAPGCESEGYSGNIICGYCGEEVNVGETLAPIGHSYVVVDSKPATNAEEGYKDYECTNCADTYTVTIPRIEGFVETYTYAWDFTDVDNSAETIADFRAADDTFSWWRNTWTDENYDGIHDETQYEYGHYYDESNKAYVVKIPNSNMITVSLLERPADADGQYLPSTLVASGKTLDANANNGHNNFGVLVGRDENGIYYYRVYVDTTRTIRRELMYVQYLYYGGNWYGVHSPITETANCANMVKLCSNIDVNRSTEETVAAYLEGQALTDAVDDVLAQFPVVVKDMSAFTYTYHATVDNNVVDVYCVIEYNDGANSYKWTTLTESYDMANLPAAAAEDVQFANYNNLGHSAIQADFGFLATPSASGAAYNCGVYGVTAEYTRIVESICAHDGTTTKTGEKAATCTEDGYTGDTVCDLCQRTLVKGEKIDMLGHTAAGEGVVTAPTCEAEGYTTYHCSTCDTDYTADEVAALGHDYKVETVAATCTAKGSETTTCSRCDYSSVVELDMIPHTESDWVVDKEATETEDGSKHTACTVCGTTIKTETIPALGSAPDYVLGDANGDGKTTILDAIAVARYTSNLVSLGDTALTAANVNGDAKTTILDAVIIAKYTSKVIDKFPIE